MTPNELGMVAGFLLFGVGLFALGNSIGHDQGAAEGYTKAVHDLDGSECAVAWNNTYCGYHRYGDVLWCSEPMPCANGNLEADR